MPIVALKCYEPGDLIHKEEPFVRILRHDLWDKVCSGCYEFKKDLKKCSACSVMQFCGKNCQKRAWPDHKEECPYLRNYKDFRYQPLVHMIGNIILKLKGRDWKTVTKTILGKEVSFNDMVSHTEGKTKIQVLLDAQGIEEPLKAYIGIENLPNKAIILELLGKVFNNRFGFQCKESTTQNSDGWSLYIGVSKLDHSCIPNVTSDFNADAIAIRAIKNIKQLEQVTISYQPMIVTLDAPLVYNSFKVSTCKGCHCIDCSQEFGQSKLTKILDVTKASAVIEESDCTLTMISLLSLLNYRVTDIVSSYRLKNILYNQEGVLGRTNLLRMQVLAHLCFRDGPCEERIAGLVELEESMKQVWGEYYGELIKVYKKLISAYTEARNLQEALNYTKKLFKIEKVSRGLPFDDSEKDLEEKMLCYIIKKVMPELLNK